MTIQDVCREVTNLRPNNTADIPVIVRYLNEIEGRAVDEVMSNCEECPEKPEYGKNTPANQELLVHSPYDQIYIYFCLIKIDERQGDYDRADKMGTVFDKIWNAWADFYHRTHPGKNTRMKFY